MTLYIDISKGRRAKQPVHTNALVIASSPAGGKRNVVANASPTSAGITGGVGAGSRGGKVLGVSTAGRSVYETELKDRSEQGSASGLIGHTAKQVSKKSLALYIKENDEINKAALGGVPVGTVHRWNDGSNWKKMGPGNWVLVTQPGSADHPQDEATDEPVRGPQPMPGIAPISNPWEPQFKKYGAERVPTDDVHQDEVTLNLKGDVHSHWLAQWRDSTTGIEITIYTKEFHRRNHTKKAAGVYGFTDSYFDRLSKGIEKVLSSSNIEKSEAAPTTDDSLLVYMAMHTGLDVDPKNLEKGQFCLLTLLGNQVAVEGSTVTFDYIGKNDVRILKSIEDTKLAKLVSNKLATMANLNSKLFTDVTLDSSTAFMREYVPQQYNITDLRTRNLIKKIADFLDSTETAPPPPIKNKSKLQVAAKNKAYQAEKLAATILCNSPAEPGRSHIHPHVWDAWKARLGFDDNVTKAWLGGESTFDRVISTPVPPAPAIPDEDAIEEYLLPLWVRSGKLWTNTAPTMWGSSGNVFGKGLYILLNNFEKSNKNDAELELYVGTNEEFEHTSDPKEAAKIAKVHIDEDPDYYAKLNKVGLLKKVKKAGIYVIEKGRRLADKCIFQGLHISVENSAGDERSGTSKDGTPWSTTMQYPYGYILGTTGTDGEHLDCYVGPDKEAKNAFVIRQKNPDTGAYDEDKVMLGFSSVKEAKEIYLAHYDNPNFFDSIRTIPMDAFIALLKHQKGKKLKLTNDSRFMRKSRLYVVEKGRSVRPAEADAKISREQDVQAAGVSVPRTPDDPAVGRNWRHDDPSTTEAGDTNEAVDEQEDEGDDEQGGQADGNTSTTGSEVSRKSIVKDLFIYV